MAEESIQNGFIQTPTGGSNPPTIKKKRNLPGNPDPGAEVIALSPQTLMATNRFLCEICGKGFQRDQNLQLHRRGHNLPWKLKQRTSKEVRKRVYVCPEKGCVHHHPSRALGDLTGIKKHFCRKHGEKKWKCEKCSKRYAVQSDWKAHSKTCGTREYKCDCGTIFSRRDSFITHRAFCDALAEESARVNAGTTTNICNAATGSNINYLFTGSSTPQGPCMPPQPFTSIFKPIISSTDETLDPTRRGGFSLWMGQLGSQQGHETLMGNGLQEMHQHQNGALSSDAVYGNYQMMNWAFGSKPSDSTEELTSTSLPLSNGKAAVSVPILYSTQHHSDHHHHQTPSAVTNMSATALLQKAAQIGVTATTTGPSFMGGFGLKCSDNQVEEGNKFCGVVYGTNPTITNMESHVESPINDLSTLKQMQMCHSKHLNRQIDQEGAAGGQTRDFLGVGMQSICQPPSVNGWI